MARLELKNIDKEYAGGVVAVRDVTLDVADGELVVLVGPSGCGKSTLLALIAGLEPISRGTLSIDGRVANDLSPQGRNVAMVFQDYALYPHLTVRGNLEFPLRMRRMAKAERDRRVRETAALLGIELLLDRLPKAISGGQRQRVAMGRALVRQPTVFLLDEPLSNLDAKLRTQVRSEIRGLQRRTGTTMIYVTHDQSEAMTLGDRVAVLNEGRLQQVGAPDEIYRAPANVFVAGFIGSPPMNLLEAQVTRAEDGITIEVGGRTVRRVADGNGARVLRELAGETVTVGCRPESLRVEEADASEALAARVTEVEYLGHETLVHLELEGAAQAEVSGLVLREDGASRRRAGESLHVCIDAGELRVFDAGGEAVGDV